MMNIRKNIKRQMKATGYGGRRSPFIYLDLYNPSVACETELTASTTTSPSSTPGPPPSPPPTDSKALTRPEKKFRHPARDRSIPFPIDPFCSPPAELLTSCHPHSTSQAGAGLTTTFSAIGPTEARGRREKLVRLRNDSIQSSLLLSATYVHSATYRTDEPPLMTA